MVQTWPNVDAKLNVRYFQECHIEVCLSFDVVWMNKTFLDVTFNNRIVVSRIVQIEIPQTNLPSKQNHYFYLAVVVDFICLSET
jgi:hypothetical protein